MQDHGSQFTSFVWTDQLKRRGTRILMDGGGRCMNNPQAFRRTDGRNTFDMSCLWWSLKDECVYLHACETGSHAKACAESYNHQRPHAARGGRPPDVACFKAPKPIGRCRH